MLIERLNELKKMIVTQSGIVREMIEKSIEGLVNNDSEILNTIISDLEKQVNAIEIRIDEMCTSMIALFHPEAKDLRTIMMLYKMTSDLERMGDCAVNICESALFLISKPPLKKYMDVPRMLNETTRMLSDIMTAFLNEDVELAIKVCKRDSIVDDLRDQILRELITYMFSDPSTIERSLHILRIVNNLEKIADITTNIGEETVFIARGKVIKHYNESV